MLRLSAIRIYPIKSTAAVPLGSAAVERPGLAGDRRWMVVDAAGVFVSQRSHAVLARVGAAIRPEGLRVEAPGRAPLLVRTPPKGAARPVAIWDDRVDAADAGDAAADWFGAVLGMPCRLVHLSPTAHRAVDPDYGADGDTVSFADGYPLLLATEASLAALNERLASAGEEAVPMDRFRPNVVVRGGEAFAEDGWSRVRIGEATFRVVKPCKRCRVVTIDQATGAVGREPLRTLTAFRRGPDGGVFFGQNLIPDGPATIRTGDSVEVLG